MPLLILMLIAPLLLFCALLAFCAFLASREERRVLLISPRPPAGAATPPLIAAKPRRAGVPFAALPAVHMFDADWAPLWETQLGVVQLLSAAGADGVNEHSLQPLYREEARRYPELYDGSTFQEWLDFLERANLATRHAGSIAITHAGREFLLVQEQRHWTRR